METGKAKDRRDGILDDAVRVFGRYGYQKTSMQDIAAAAGISKPGIYLHFSGKEEIFMAAIELYLTRALEDVVAQLSSAKTTLEERLNAALWAWFGRHLRTFTPESFDVIEVGDRLSADKVAGVKRLLIKAFSDAFIHSGYSAEAAADRARVLFLCGLSWKQHGTTPEQLRSGMETSVRVCCGNVV